MRNCQKLYERLITGVHEIGHDPARFEEGAEYNHGWNDALAKAEDLIVKSFMKHSYCGAENLDLITDAAKAGIDDPVNHPAHYCGKIEVIDFILDRGADFLIGNVLKYVSRAGKKSPDTEIQDLEKARWYLDKKIELLKEAESEKQKQLAQALAWTE